MTDKSLSLNAWEQNQIHVFSVQGENNSRILRVTIYDISGVQDAMSTAPVVNRPVDLTGTSVRLYVSKPDGTTVFNDGNVVEPESGVAEFELTYQMLAAPGQAACEVLISKTSGESLKTIGLTLDIQPSSMETAVESSNEFSALTTALSKVDTVADDMEDIMSASRQQMEETKAVKEDIIQKRDSGFFDGADGRQGPQGIQGIKGDKGDKGDRGNSGVTVPTNGFFTLYVNSSGNLVATVADGATAPSFSIRNGQLIYTI